MNLYSLGDEDKAIRLIEEGANLNVTNENGYSPLFRALFSGKKILHLTISI